MTFVEAYSGQLVHVDVVCAPTVENVFTGHCVHVSVPVVVLYEPATHAVQVFPSNNAEYPARHVQFVIDILDAAANVFAGQLMHVFSLSAPIAGWNIPLINYMKIQKHFPKILNGQPFMKK